MASLDQMEGEGLELAALLAVVIIIVAIVLFYMGSKGLLNWLLKLLQELEAWLKKLLSGGGGGKTFLGSGGGNPGPQVQDANPLFQIPGLTAENFPLQNTDIPGVGGDTNADQGSGVGSSINGSPFYFSPDGGS